MSQRQQSEKLRTFKAVSAERQADLKEMKSLADERLKQTINDEITKIQQRHPGIRYATAHSMLQTQRPGLFLPDDAADRVEKEFDVDSLPGDKRTKFAQKLAEYNRGTTFEDALLHLKRIRPEMFDPAHELPGLRRATT